MLWRILSKTGLIYFAGAFEAFSAAVFAFVLIAFYGEAIPTGELPTEGEIPIYVRSNGIHTELILPTETPVIDWKEIIAPEDFGDSISHDYLVMGWGDKGFYMNTPEWSDLTAKTAASALLLPTSTAMHVAYREVPEENADCIKLMISKQQYAKICSFAKESFIMKDAKAELIPNKGYGVSDNFYEANNSYHLFRTCNTWTSNALKHAGIRTSALAVFPNAVMGHFR
ncbi:MAG: TIGR02117 family protein [Crocinitomicaceae bacterium]